MSKTMSWIRLYVEVLDDPKVGMLPAHLKWPWVEFLLLTEKSGGALPTMARMAYMLRRDQASIQADLDGLVAAGLIDKDKDGTLTPHNWGGRQFRDTNADRQRRFKDKRKKAVTAEVTLPVTETATVEVTPEVTVTDNTKVTAPPAQASNAPRAEQRQNTEQKQRENPAPEEPSEPSFDSENRGEVGASQPSAEPAKAKRATRLKEDWVPSEADVAFALNEGFSLADIEREATRFRNYWLEKSGKDATKLAWARTWQNWILNAVPSGRKPIPGAPVPFQMKAKPKPRVMLDVATFNAETWKRHIDGFLRDHTWDEDQLGPDPESRHCHIPKTVLDANGIRRPPITVNLNNGQKPQAWPTTPTVPDLEEFTQ